MRSECGNGALHNTAPLCYIAGKACSTVSKRTLPHCGLKPQLKRGVEHDCYIYAWNSACTMEGVDIVMVWNSLLNDCRCVRRDGPDKAGNLRVYKKVYIGVLG